MGIYKGTTVTTDENIGTFSNPDNIKDGTDDTNSYWEVIAYSGSLDIDYIRLADFSPTLGTDLNLDLELQWRADISVTDLQSGYLEIFRRHSFNGGSSWVQDDLITLYWDDIPYTLAVDARQVINTGAGLPATLVIEYIMRTVSCIGLSASMTIYQLAVIAEDMSGIGVIGEP